MRGRHNCISTLCSFLLSLAHYYGKRKNKRIGRPPGGHSNLEVAMKKPNKRRKRRKHFFVHKKKRSSTSVDNTPAGSPQVGPCQQHSQIWDVIFGCFIWNSKCWFLVTLGLQQLFVFFPTSSGQWGRRGGWPGWGGWRVSDWGQHLGAPRWTAWRIRGVREEIPLIISHPERTVSFPGPGPRQAEEEAQDLFLFWRWK